LGLDFRPVRRESVHRRAHNAPLNGFEVIPAGAAAVIIGLFVLSA
jgi:uncharacterized MAPEG superfamily protein